MKSISPSNHPSARQAKNGGCYYYLARATCAINIYMQQSHFGESQLGELYLVPLAPFLSQHWGLPTYTVRARSNISA
eukprot:5908250-Amphidinium_carterae.1